jgi:hypothetical protein
MGIIGLMAFNTVIGGILLLMPSYLVSINKLITDDDPYQKIILFGKRNNIDSKKKRLVNTTNTALPLQRIKEQFQRIGFW